MRPVRLPGERGCSIEGSDGNRAGPVPEVDPQKWTAERRAEYARKRGGEAKPSDPSAIMRRIRASLGNGPVRSGDHGR